MSKVEKTQKFLSQDGFVRASALTATGLLQEMQKVNAMSPLATAVAGRALIASLLLASRQKEDQVSLHFNGNGPIGKVFAEASYSGKCRVNVANPNVDLPLVNGDFNVKDAIGIGVLNVTHIAPFQKQSYKGTVIIKTGEVAQDVAYFLEQSFQVPSIVAVNVGFNKEAMVDSAGGLLIELMPGHKEEHIHLLENNASKAKSLSSLIMEGASAKELVKEYTQGLQMKNIDYDNKLEYFCPCNIERVKNSLVLLGEKEIEALMIKDDDTEIACDFCGEKYYLNKNDLEKLRIEAQKKSLH